MNILFVADVSIAEVIGGAERALLEQSTRLSQRGHNIHILTRRLPIHDKVHAVIEGVDEWRYEYNPRNPATFVKTIWFNAKRMFEFLEQQYHFDCINFHQPFSALAINHSVINRDFHKIYTCHSLSFEEYLSRDCIGPGITHTALKFLQVIARKKIEKDGLLKSDAIVVLSKFSQKKLVAAYGIPKAKIQIIPGGVDLGKFHKADLKTETRARFNIPQHNVVLFTVRNLVRRMGLENLILAFNELSKKFEDIYLVIGGNGPLEDALTALLRDLKIENKVHLAGYIPEKILPLYYQMADLFVLPTKELEGFGLVTLEALASGLPVLGTPIGGTKEILGRFNPDFIFDNTGPDSISKKIIEKYKIIKENPLKWEEISHQCRNFIEHHYSWDKNVDSLEYLFANRLNT